MLTRLLPALLLLLTGPAQAVLIDSGDGTGNTTAPADDPGFAHVGSRGSLSAIYVGYGWVLSAAHVGLGDVVLGGVTYPALSGSRIVLIHSGTTQADLELFRIDPAPALYPLPIRASVPAVDDSVIMIGNGRNRGDAVSVFPPPSRDDGYYWELGRTIRWGTNVVHSIEPDLTIGSRVTDSFSTSFSRSGTVDECQAAQGDSGGAVFIKSGSTWELAGVMHAIAVYPEQVGDLAETALYGNLTYAADLSQYRTQILDVITPDCGNGYLTIDEECDDGNTEAGDCCSPTCQYEAPGTACGDPGDTICDNPDSCDGAGSCLANYEPGTTECRADAGECDVAEVCDGAGACPDNAYEPPGTACGDPGDTICDNPDTCDAVGSCQDNYEPAMTECRPSAGVCDVAENCTGSAPECPADEVLDGVPCPDGDVCNGDEVCEAGVCEDGAPLVCDDADPCTTDSCDAIQGCEHDPIPGCGIPVPGASPAGRVLLGLMVLAAGALFLAQRRAGGS